MGNSLDSAWYQRQSERLAELAGLRAKVEECYLAWNRASEELAEKTAEYRKGIDEGGGAPIMPKSARTIRPSEKTKPGGRNGPALKKALRAICAAPCDITALARAIGTAEYYLLNSVLPKIAQRGLATNYLGTWTITDAGRAMIPELNGGPK